MTSSETQLEYTVPFTVRSYEVDASKKATLASVSNYFQEAAGLHADHLNFDISHLQKKGLTWVLYKMDIQVTRFPSRWEGIKVVTRPSAGDGIRAFRDYELLDGDLNRIAAGISQWMVLDLKTRRPVRMPAEILEMGARVDNHVIEPDKKPIRPAAENNGMLICTVGAGDLDMNSHVNNVIYINWMEGYLPSDLLSGRKCTGIEIQYIAESVKEDRIYHIWQPEEENGRLRVRHSLLKNSNRQPIANGITTWTPAPRL